MRRVPSNRVPTIQTIRQAQLQRRLDAYGDVAADTFPSFTQPGIDCANLFTDPVWLAKPIGEKNRAYCDCAFLELHSATELTLNGAVWPLPILDWVPNADMLNDAEIKRLLAYLGPSGTVGPNGRVNTYSMKVKVWTSRGAFDSNWNKCMRGACAAPAGCYNPAKAPQNDPFDVNPFLLFPPHTSAGAAARSIPVRNADITYTISQLFSYDASAYDPVELWAKFWTNPAVFSLLGLKAGLIPFNPQLLYFATPVPTLMIAALIEISNNPKYHSDYGQFFFNAMWKGWVQFAGLLLNYIPKCGIGLPGACGVGVVLQQVAKDQITSGEINKVLDPGSRAVIIFLSKNGASLVDRIYALVQNGAKLDPSLLSWLSGTFKDIAGFPGMDPKIKLSCSLTGRVLDVAYIIANDMVRGVIKTAAVPASGNTPGKPAVMEEASMSRVVDDAVAALLGFRPSAVLNLIQNGYHDAAKVFIEGSVITSGVTMSEMKDLVSSLEPVLNDFIKTLMDLNNTLGGAIQEFVSQFRMIKDTFAVAGTTVADTITKVDTAYKTGGANLPALATPSTPGTPGTPGTPSPVVTGKSSAAMIGLAAGGFVAGGPVGALLGLGIGLVMNHQQPASQAVVNAVAVETAQSRVRVAPSVANTAQLRSAVTKQATDAAAAAVAKAKAVFGAYGSRTPPSLPRLLPRPIPVPTEALSIRSLRAQYGQRQSSQQAQTAQPEVQAKVPTVRPTITKGGTDPGLIEQAEGAVQDAIATLADDTRSIARAAPANTGLLVLSAVGLGVAYMMFKPARVSRSLGYHKPSYKKRKSAK